MLIRSIIFVTNDYPYVDHIANTFVEQLVNEIENNGIECTVIAPQSITRCLFRKIKLIPYEKKVKGKNIFVYRPFYISFSNILPNINRVLFVKSVKQVFKKIPKKADAIYGHFVIASGIAAVEIGEEYNIPSYIGSGESSLDGLDNLDKNYIKDILGKCNGIISVSTENKNFLLNRGFVNKDKVIVLPNAINDSIFYKRNKAEMRKKFGFKQEDFIVAFVGHFNERKGILRLSEALKEIKDIKSIFIGRGPKVPDCPGILYRGAVKHNKVPEYLSASDVFVLPTLAEGCCNAIIEAMACGLPIVSSNLPCNDDILNESNSIRINPRNIKEIVEAITRIRDDLNLRNSMAVASLSKVEKHKISSRTSKIIEFIKNRLQEKHFLI